MKKRADYPGTFVANEGYHCDEKVEMNRLGPITSSANGQRTAFRRRSSVASHAPPTIVNGGDLAVKELSPFTSTPSELVSLARVHRRPFGGSDRVMQPWKREEEIEGKRKWEEERERERESLGEPETRRREEDDR